MLVTNNTHYETALSLILEQQRTYATILSR